MATQFILTMNLGNEAMQTADDIAARLRVAADKLEANYSGDYLDEWTGLGAPVMDTNGNRVGGWTIARAVGLSRQQVHTIVANATAPDVAPFEAWEQDAPAVVEVAPEAAWGEVF